MPAPAIRVSHVEVRRDRIVASVCVSDERYARTTPRLIASLLPGYPHLLEHCCVNDRGTTFAAVAACTSTPHLLEHMSIENQARSEQGGNADLPRESLEGAHGSFRGMPGAGCLSSKDAGGGSSAGGIYMGKTRWVDRAARLARVELSYADDLIALAALRDAARDLSKALASEGL